MPTSAYRSTLRLLVRPLEGESVREVLGNLVAERGASRARVEGSGRLDGVRFVGEAQPRLGTLEVIQLTGHVTPEGARLTLIGQSEGAVLVTGVLLDARAVELELDVELFEEEAPAVVSVAAPVPAPTWAEVAAASAAAEPVVDETEQPMPAIGDRFEHPTFGLCTVEKVDADEEFIMARNSSQRLMRLSLDILRLELVREENGKRLFRTRVARAAGKVR